MAKKMHNTNGTISEWGEEVGQRILEYVYKRNPDATLREVTKIALRMIGDGSLSEFIASLESEE